MLLPLYVFSVFVPVYFGQTSTVLGLQRVQIALLCGVREESLVFVLLSPLLCIPIYPIWEKIYFVWLYWAVVWALEDILTHYLNEASKLNPYSQQY